MRLSIDQLLRLDGQVALVTGAARGLGAAIVDRLGEAGATVVAHRRIDADLRDEAAVVSIVRRIIAEHGRLDLLVNNAGDQALGGVCDLSADAWRDMLDSNLVGPAVLMREFAATGTGRAIVNISSIEAVALGGDHAHYGASKAALLHATRAAAIEFAPTIRVNAVLPGLIDRPGLSDDWPSGVERYLDHSLLGRLGDPSDIADAVLFLLSDASRWITGTTLVVDGGLTGGWRW